MRANKNQLLKSEREYIALQSKVEKMPPEIQEFYTYQLSNMKRQVEIDKKAEKKRQEVQRAMVIAHRWDRFMSAVALTVIGVIIFTVMFFLSSSEYWIDLLLKAIGF